MTIAEPQLQPPITVDDFARIHGVIRAVLGGADVSAEDLSKSCIFFATAGAYLLERKHGLGATPVAGAAFIAVSEGPSSLDVLAYAKRDGANGPWCSDVDAFHAWVEVTAADGQVWVVDFTSPLYADAMRKHRPAARPPFKAFMRPVNDMIDPPDSLQDSGVIGDFFLQGSKEHTVHMLQQSSSSLQFGDLIGIIEHWYVAAPGSMQEELVMGSNDGSTRKLRFKQPKLSGSWESTNR